MSIDVQKPFGTRECPSCATEVAANENRCPICGYEFPNRPLPHRTFLVAVGVVVLLAFLVLLLSGLV
jgi:hypothetical protein